MGKWPVDLGRSEKMENVRSNVQTGKTAIPNASSQRTVSLPRSVRKADLFLDQRDAKQNTTQVTVLDKWFSQLDFREQRGSSEAYERIRNEYRKLLYILEQATDDWLI